MTKFSVITPVTLVPEGKPRAAKSAEFAVPPTKFAVKVAFEPLIVAVCGPVKLPVKSESPASDVLLPSPSTQQSPETLPPDALVERRSSFPISH